MKLSRTQFDVLVHLQDSGMDTLPETLQASVEDRKSVV